MSRTPSNEWYLLGPTPPPCTTPHNLCVHRSGLEKRDLNAANIIDWFDALSCPCTARTLIYVDRSVDFQISLNSEL